MKVEIQWRTFDRKQKIWDRVLIVCMWIGSFGSSFRGVQRFGVSWPAVEWALTCGLLAVLATALILRIERAQREQEGE